MTPHLTEPQLYDLLSATPDPASPLAQAHLAACPLCRDELATLRSSLTNFRLAATNLSLLHTPPRPTVGNTIHRSFFTLPHAIWAAGLASVLAVSAVTVSTLHRPTPATPHIATAPAAEPVSDEALLQDIDSDLSTSVPPSLQPLDTTPAAASETTTTSTSN
jgi:hypothetical protein